MCDKAFTGFTIRRKLIYDFGYGSIFFGTEEHFHQHVAVMLHLPVKGILN